MSLILDALRKSEAERRRGQAPDLFAPTPLSRKPSSPGRDVRGILGLVGVLVLIAVVWWWRGASAPTAAPVAPVVTPEATIIAPTPVTVASNRVEPARDAHTDTPVAKPVPPPATVRESTTDTPPPAASIAPAVPPAPIDLPTIAEPVPEAEALPTLSALSTEERASLPALKLSMHYWSETAERRFAIIDGQRVTEGSSLGGSIVAQIRRDGVVLDLRGRRYLLPRP